MLDKSKTYLIVGLGLLGGKYAQVLSSHGYRVTGIARSRETIDYALQHGYIAEGATEDFDALVTGADCIIFGLYPTVLLDWVKQYGQLIRPGTLLTDVSGVKRGVAEPVQGRLLPHRTGHRLPESAAPRHGHRPGRLPRPGAHPVYAWVLLQRQHRYPQCRAAAAERV